MAAHLLILAPQLPPFPPNQGTTIRNYNLLRELAQRGHSVDLLAFAADPDHDSASIAHLTQFCRQIRTAPAPQRTALQRIATTFTLPLPDMGLRLASPTMHGILQEMLQENRYDVAQVEGIEMSPYLLQIAAQADGLRLIFDDHNAEYVLQRRAFETDLQQPRRWPAALYSLIQWLKLRRYERRVCRAADQIIAVSQTDADALLRILPECDVAVVPNGVDLDYYQAPIAHQPLEHSPALVFTGKMDFRPNVDAMLWFHAHVWPLIQQRRLDVHLYLVGKSPHPRLAPLVQDPRVTVTGFVPDVRPYIAGAQVYVVPLRIGGGTRLKVLEAMAMGKAMVTTSLGCEGIGLRHGQEALLADTPEAFAQATLTLLADEKRREDLSAQALRFVAARYSWPQIVPRLEAVYGLQA